MQQLIRFLAMISGLLALIFSFNSCQKDEDKGECCSWSYTHNDENYAFKVCEDGSIIESYTNNGKSYTENDNWSDAYDDWSYVKDFIFEENSDMDIICN